MEKEFVPYTEALALKELGFNEPCFGRYYYKKLYPMLNPQSEETELVFEFGEYIKQTEVTILSPLYQQAFRWFREKYGIKTYVYEVLEERFVFITYTNQLDYKMSATYHPTYEEAELECLKKLISIVKEK